MRCIRCSATVAVLVASAANAISAGSGFNVVVVANENSSNSLALANYYCEKRSVPPQNVVRINWSGGNTSWTLAQYQNTLLDPLLAALESRGLTNQIEFVVLSMDIPYRVTDGGQNGTTSALFYGFKTNTPPPSTNLPVSCSLPPASFNEYAGSEDIFRERPPTSPATNSFLATMITSSNLALAKRIVDSGAASDGTFPTQPVYLSQTFDSARSVRYVHFDNAIINARLIGQPELIRTNVSDGVNLGSIFGLEIGRATFSLSGTTFVPGAIADSLTSYAGVLFEPFGQTTALAPLAAGAAGSYGTVVEPCNYIAKFPVAQVYFYQGRGFSLAESYYMSITNPYQGLIVGEPLAAPFAMTASAEWNLPSSAVLTGTTNLSVQFTAAEATRPMRKVDLFLDGRFLQTLTNIPPADGNVIYATLPGRTNMSYMVGPSETIASVAQGLAQLLNSPLNSNATEVLAIVHGDRIELQSTALNRSADETFVSVSNSLGSADSLTTMIFASRSNFMDTTVAGRRAFDIGVGVVPDDVLNLSVTKTNGMNVTLSITNFSTNATLNGFVSAFANAINTHPDLQGADGLLAEDITVESATQVRFYLRARSTGLSAAQIQVQVTGDFDIDPPGLRRLDENIGDVRPRNHLYVTAGVTNLALDFPLDTTALPDGWHELTVVAYEGSHVQTQTRVSRQVLIQNRELAATLESPGGSTNVLLEDELVFAVAANATNIAGIELFSTGGSLGVVSNQPMANFSVAGSHLQIGVHPFYAVVTDLDGFQYRTETKWLRVAQSFGLSISAPPPTLSWQADTDQVYEVWSTTNVGDAFQLRETIAPTNSAVQWVETNDAPTQFYRVRQNF